jgi:phosphoenolpyruvate carboxylase
VTAMATPTSAPNPGIRAAPPGEVALRHYLTEVHYLGSELSVSAMLASCSPEMQALAESSPDTNEHRMDEPYRRALTGVYARLAATLQGTDRHAKPRATPCARKTRTASAEEFAKTCAPSKESLLDQPWHRHWSPNACSR